MRPLIVTEFISLDGVVEAPGGEPGYAHSGWVGGYFDDDLGAYKLAEQLAAETLLLGRRTYTSFAGAWPLRDGAMAEKINTMEKVVVSATIGDPGRVLVSGRLLADITKALPAKPVDVVVDGRGGSTNSPSTVTRSRWATMRWAIEPGGWQANSVAVCR